MENKKNNNIRKTIKTDLDVIKGSSSTFFTGVDDLVGSKRLDPLVNGYSFVRVLDYPTWFNDDPDLKYFKTMIEKNTRSFQGLSDITLNTAEHVTGFAGNQFNVATGIVRGNTEFTTGHKEYSGGVMRKLFQKYISMIRDPRTGIAMYPSVYNCEYSSANHTCTLLYMVVRPDVLNKSSENIIEYASIYTNAMPTNIPLSDLYQFEAGQQDSPSVTINWVGMPEMGPDVEDLALKVLREDILTLGSDKDGIPFIDSYGYNKDAVQLQTTGLLQKIYNPKK